jgi:AraC-like DNA-binding protein
MTQYKSLPIWMESGIELLRKYAVGRTDELPQACRQLLLEPSSVEHSRERVDVELIGYVWREVARLSGDPAIGVNAVEHYFQPASWRSVGLAVLCSSSVREALERLVRYAVFLTEVSNFSLVEEDDCLVVSMETMVPGEVVGYEVMDFGFAAILKLLRMISHDTLEPVEVRLLRPKPDDIGPYLRSFGENVRFDQIDTAVVFKLVDVDKPLVSASQELALAQDRITEHYLEGIGGAALSIKVKNVIVRLLPNGEVMAADAAKSLNMSVRSLQRKLSNEGVSFKEMVADVRQTLALSYLADTKHPLNEIAYLLGFSDHSNFTRAFKRWFGVSPSEKRHELMHS